MINLSLSQFKNLIPDYVIQVAEVLQSNNYEAYLVGGSVRDILLGKSPGDFDIATNAYPDDVVRIFEKSIPTGAKFGTITVVVESQSGERFDIQLTTYRAEGDYIGGRWPSKVEFARTIEEDLSRRDFTMNAIALNLQHFDENDVSVNSILVDPFNGLKDLELKTIRAVRDPLERFSEDGLRAVRACRLASQLDFNIEQKTWESILQTLHITKMVSVERFREELMRILLKSAKPSKGLRLLKDSGILELFIPELLEGLNVVQPEFHVSDVFDHSLETVDVAEDSIKVAALFHDIGKPRTRSEDEDGIHFYGHDVEGAKITEEIMRRLKFPNFEIDHTVKLVRWHMFYYPSADWRTKNNHTNFEGTKINQDPNSRDAYGWSDGAIRRLMQNVGGEDAIDDLMKLRIADADSNPKTDFDPKEIDALSQRISDVRAKEMALKVTDLDISGHDLTENLGIQPGPVMGSTLKYLLDIVVEDPAYNKKLDLLRLAKEHLDKSNIKS